MGFLQTSIILEPDVRANQPDPGDVPVGALYCVTDEGNTLERNNGSSWDSFAPSSAINRPRTVGFVIGNGTDEITTGLKGFSPPMPYAGTITKWTILSIDESGPATAGAIVLDVWKDTYGNYPPTDADTITGGNEAEVTASASKAQDSTLTDWTLSVSVGDIFGFYVDSVSDFTKILFALEITPS